MSNDNENNYIEEEFDIDDIINENIIYNENLEINLADDFIENFNNIVINDFDNYKEKIIVINNKINNSNDKDNLTNVFTDIKSKLNNSIDINWKRFNKNNYVAISFPKFIKENGEALYEDFLVNDINKIEDIDIYNKLIEKINNLVKLNKKRKLSNTNKDKNNVNIKEIDNSNKFIEEKKEADNTSKKDEIIDINTLDQNNKINSNDFKKSDIYNYDPEDDSESASSKSSSNVRYNNYKFLVKRTVLPIIELKNLKINKAKKESLEKNSYDVNKLELEIINNNIPTIRDIVNNNNSNISGFGIKISDYELCIMYNIIHNNKSYILEGPYNSIFKIIINFEKEKNYNNIYFYNKDIESDNYNIVQKVFCLELGVLDNEYTFNYIKSNNLINYNIIIQSCYNMNFNYELNIYSKASDYLFYNYSKDMLYFVINNNRFKINSLDVINNNLCLTNDDVLNSNMIVNYYSSISYLKDTHPSKFKINKY